LRIVVTPPATGTPQIYQLPQYLSNVTPRAREIFLQGKTMGNKPNVFAKIGDSLSDESWFLYAVGEGRANLNGYQNLQDTVDFFISGFARTSNSFADDAISAAGGWDSFALLDPAKAAGFGECAGMNPVECEIKTLKPSVAIILIGSNDGEWNVSNGLYGGNIRRVVQICIDNGVVPVLTTVPWSVYRADPSVYNNVIVTIAAEYQIPVIDYATPMYGLPNHGVRDDGVHPSVPPDLNPANFSNENLQFGYTLRNLLTLQMLDALYHTVLY
jgi:hypothetical protein